jgi:signal recognition particle receptor subunit beta
LDQNMLIPNQLLRKRLVENLNSLVAWAENENKKELVKLMVYLAEKLKQERFNLVVLGEFKRGKSTFLNAILGDSILPTAVVPLTSVITHIAYGRTFSVEVRFKSGSRQEISPAELPEFITEKENPENRKEVDEVWVSYPAALLMEGVHLIDTPGVGSVFQHNTDLAMRFLPQVDAVIFILSADPPISHSEMNFLREIRQYAAKIFFIQNKINLLEVSDREESFRFTHKILSDLLDGAPIRLFPISARWALSGKMEKDQAKISKSLLPEYMDPTLDATTI